MDHDLQTDDDDDEIFCILKVLVTTVTTRHYKFTRNTHSTMSCIFFFYFFRFRFQFYQTFYFVSLSLSLLQNCCKTIAKYWTCLINNLLYVCVAFITQLSTICAIVYHLLTRCLSKHLLLLKQFQFGESCSFTQKQKTWPLPGTRQPQFDASNSSSYVTNDELNKTRK